MERIAVEGNATEADIFMTVDAGVLWQAAEKEIFQEVDSDILNQNIPYVAERGGIFYNQVGSQASSRKQYVQHAGMQHIPLMRIVTIPDKSHMLIALLLIKLCQNLLNLKIHNY